MAKLEFTGLPERIELDTGESYDLSKHIEGGIEPLSISLESVPVGASFSAGVISALPDAPESEQSIVLVVSDSEPAVKPVAAYPELTKEAPPILYYDVNINKLFYIDGYMQSYGRYYRGIMTVVMSGSKYRMGAHCQKDGGGAIALAGGRYNLLGDKDGSMTNAKVIASVDVAPGWNKHIYFDIDLDPLDDREWLVTSVQGPDPTETSIRFPVFINKSGTDDGAIPDKCPAIAGSYEIVNGQRPCITWLPAGFDPPAFPLAARSSFPPPFSEALPASQIYKEPIVIPRGKNQEVRRPAWNVKHGFWTVFDRQPYDWSILTDMPTGKNPNIGVLEGPRNIGTTAMPTSITPNHHGGFYFTDTWRLGKCEPDGTITTLLGWGHENNVPNDRSGVQKVKLFGDWERVIAAGGKPGLHEPWDFIWDKRTVGLVGGATPPPWGELGPPHEVGPRGLIPDSQNDRIIETISSATDRSVPMSASILVSDIHDPWDMAESEDGSTFFVTERKSHRITERNSDTGELIRVVVSGDPVVIGKLCYLNSSRYTSFQSGKSFVHVRDAVDCALPEGLDRCGDWLYWGSMAMMQVRKVNLKTGEIKVVGNVAYNGSTTKYVKIAVSDGTFGPAGTVFVASWEVSQAGGLPLAILPDGKLWNLGGGNEKRIVGFGNVGWHGYNGTVGVGFGAMYCSSSSEGITKFTKGVPGDKVIDANRYERGRVKFIPYVITHGPNAFGFHGFKLPWGVDANMDYFFECLGHIRT